jgi:GTPase SAR1 family protein
MYFRGSQAAMIVFDLYNPPSFEKAKDWLRELRVNHNNPQGLIIGLVGNKLDLVQSSNSRPITSGVFLFQIFNILGKNVFIFFY